MSVLVLIMLFVCIGMPLIYAWRVFRLDEQTIAEWLLMAADATVLVALVLLVGRWDMAGYYMRFVVLAVFLAAVLWSLRKHASRPWLLPTRNVLRSHWSTVASLVLLGAGLGYVASGMSPPPRETRELTFPLKEGRFMVAHGGGNRLLNHHSGHDAQRYAADITAINALGLRAAGLAPKDLERYVIYGAPVVSPCAGTVVGTRDDLPDLTPPKSDRDTPRGNHVIIDCGGFNVELAHLQPGSVSVGTSDPVTAGDPIGKVGNSGNTTEPHLHVHAVDPEHQLGVPMSFNGKAPVRNRIYFD